VVPENFDLIEHPQSFVTGAARSQKSAYLRFWKIADVGDDGRSVDSGRLRQFAF
jgi:hypothetical protein